VISYGTIEGNAPRRLHRLFAIEAFLGGVTPWPASSETFDLLPLLKPLGELRTCRFADWRTPAVSLSERRCAAAVYSRPDESWLLLANLESTPRDVTCVVRPDRLPCPLPRLTSATRLPRSPAATPGSEAQTPVELDAARLSGEGIKLTLPGDDAIVVRVR
jgi:hypothetical protein